jgi:hypothetical protein
MEEAPPEKPFKIHGIELISFSIQPQSSREYSKDLLELNIKQEQKTNAEKKLVIIFTSVNIREVGKESSLASLNVACGFEIPSFNDILRENSKGEYVIAHDLSISITRISIATTRGILYSQLRGSYLQDSTLPLLPIE